MPKKLSILEMTALTNAAELVGNLQEWIEQRDELSSMPIAHLEWNPSGLSRLLVGGDITISVGEMCLYDSYNDGELPDLEFMKRLYLEELRDMCGPFAEEIEALKNHEE